MNLDEILADAVNFVVDHYTDYISALDPETTKAEFLAYEMEAAELRTFSQTWGSTAGPYGGIGGQMVTSMRVTGVRVGNAIVWYVGDNRAFTTILDNETVLASWNYGRMPERSRVLSAIPAWSR